MYQFTATICNTFLFIVKVFEAVHVGGCKGSTKVGQGSLRTLGSACEAMGGAMKQFKANKIIDCTFDWCVKEFKGIIINLLTLFLVALELRE